VTTQPELLPCPKDVETLRNANNAVALLQEIIEGLRSHPNPPTHRGVPLDGSLWFVKMCVTDLQMLQSRTPSPATHTAPRYPWEIVDAVGGGMMVLESGKILNWSVSEVKSSCTCDIEANIIDASCPTCFPPATHTQGEVEHSRERFESLHWEERCCFSTPDTITRSDYFMRGKLPSGWRYIDMYVELCWRSWCAALSMQPNTAEAHGDMVEQVTQCCQHNCSHPDATVAEQLGRTIKVGKQRIALPSHQLTEDVKEAYEEGWRNGNSHQGNLEYPYMTMQYDWNVSESRDRARPVGGEK